MQEMADSSLTSKSTPGDHTVFLDFSADNEFVGRVIIQLDSKTVPKSAENFRALCTGEKGIGSLGKPLHYKGTIVHKAVPQFMIQAGDTTNLDGTGGESIYGPFFEDENFLLQHNAPGIVGLANTGEANHNNSQFYITTVPCPHLDGKNVVVGRVIKGYGVVKEISETKTKHDKPIDKYEISDCGELVAGDAWMLHENDGTSDIYPPWPEDWEPPLDQLSTDNFMTVITNIKESGNHFYKEHKYRTAERKYKKTLAYITWYLSLPEMNTADKEFGKDVKLGCLLNLAAVKLQTHCYRECISYSNQVLELDSRNAKAIFRKAQAHVALNNDDVALQYFQNAHRLMPYDKSIIVEMRKLKRSMRDYLAQERKTFAKMFQRYQQ